MAKSINRYISELLEAYQEATRKTCTEMALDFDLTLDIYADGSYTYTATTVMMGETNEYTETGYIGLNTTNSTLYILPDDVTSGLEGSIDENGSISAKFSVGQGAPQDVVLTPVAE